MSTVSGLIIDKQNIGYSFKQNTGGGRALIFVRVRPDNSWNSSAYTKKFHKGSKDEELDLDEIWYYDKTKRYTNTKKVKLENYFKDDSIKYFETYYPSQPKNDELLVLGFVTKSGKKLYLSRTSLALEKDGDLNFSSVKPVEESKFLEELYKENYTKNKVLTIKIDSVSGNHKVDVKNDEKVSVSSKFIKYAHTPTREATEYTNVVLDCGSICNFINYKASDYTNDKLEKVGVYFHNSDTYNILPLVIEFVPKSNKQFTSTEQGKSVYYGLKSINKTGEDKSKWTRNYERKDKEDLSTILNEIYNRNLGTDIDEIISYSKYNDKFVGAISGSLTTIGAIGTGVGFFLYKNSGPVIAFMRSLF